MLSIDHDFKRSDSPDSCLSGEGVSVDPIQDSDACMGERETSIGAHPVPAVSDKQDTNNSDTCKIDIETVIYEIDDNNTVTCKIDENGFCVITTNSKCM